MAQGTREKGPVESRRQAGVVRVLDGEPLRLQSEEVERQQCREEGGKSADGHERRNEHVVDDAAAAPRGDHPDGGADDEREQERDPCLLYTSDAADERSS